MQRNNSNTPQQALVLLNDEQFLETHETLESKLPSLDNAGKVRFLFLRILKRNPAKAEEEIILDSLQKKMSWKSIIGALMNLNEFISIE